jgi:hypothetical protein
MASVFVCLRAGSGRLVLTRTPMHLVCFESKAKTRVHQSISFVLMIGLARIVYTHHVCPYVW